MTTGPQAENLQFLSDADIVERMPTWAEILDTVEHALICIADGTAQAPAKVGVQLAETHIIHAMPAYLDGVVGCKWISWSGRNSRLGMHSLAGLIILNDVTTGYPTHVLDARRLTTVRTAAVSGVALRSGVQGHPGERISVGVVGAGPVGVQHVRMLASLCPDAALYAYDRDPASCRSLISQARELGLNSAQACDSLEAAVRGRDVMISAVGRRAADIDPQIFAETRMVITADGDMLYPAASAHERESFYVDDVAQYQRFQADGRFADYPPPTCAMGEALRDTGLSLADRSLVCHLGSAATDIALCAAIIHPDR